VESWDVKVGGRKKKRFLNTDDLVAIGEELNVWKGREGSPAVPMKNLQREPSVRFYGCVGNTRDLGGRYCES